MNIAVAKLKSAINNPSTDPERTQSAVSQLRAFAADPKDSRAADALLVLRELGLDSSSISCTDSVQSQAEPSAYAVAKAKAIINDPASTPEQREAAWVKLKTVEDIPSQVRALEHELLEEFHHSSIADCDYGDVHSFCTEKEWKNPAVKSLFFDRWLPAFWKTETGSRKLVELETYGLMHNNPGKRSDADLERIAIVAELRRPEPAPTA